MDLVDYDDLKAIEDKLKNNPNYCAVLLEPIQGERGTVVPSSGYITGVMKICKKYNVLFICDEV